MEKFNRHSDSRPAEMGTRGLRPVHVRVGSRQAGVRPNAAGRPFGRRLVLFVMINIAQLWIFSATIGRRSRARMTTFCRVIAARPFAGRSG